MRRHARILLLPLRLKHEVSRHRVVEVIERAAILCPSRKGEALLLHINRLLRLLALLHNLHQRLRRAAVGHEGHREDLDARISIPLRLQHEVLFHRPCEVVRGAAEHPPAEGEAYLRRLRRRFHAAALSHLELHPVIPVRERSAVRHEDHRILLSHRGIVLPLRF